MAVGSAVDPPRFSVPEHHDLRSLCTRFHFLMWAMWQGRGEVAPVVGISSGAEATRCTGRSEELEPVRRSSTGDDDAASAQACRDRGGDSASQVFVLFCFVLVIEGAAFVVQVTLHHQALRGREAQWVDVINNRTYP